MRPFCAIVLLLAAMPAFAIDLEKAAKDLAMQEIRRKLKAPSMPGRPPVVFDAPAKAQTSFNMHWRLSARLGPLGYSDDLGDGYPGKFRLQVGGIGGLREYYREPERLTHFHIEIRKDFW